MPYTEGKEAAINGELKKARTILRPIVKQDPGTPASYYLALVEYNKGDLKAAEDLTKSFIAKNPNHIGIRLLACRVALKKDDLKGARKKLDAARELMSEPSNAFLRIEAELITKETSIKAKTYLDVIDAFYLKRRGGKPTKRVREAASSLAELKPTGQWDNDVIQAKIAYFHHAPNIDHALENYIPEVVEVSVEYDYIKWPKRIREFIYGKSVLDIGCGFGGYGTGFLIAGAVNYLGLDPVMDLDSTRVKNKRIRKPANMTMTPNEIQAICPNITLLQCTAEELSSDQKFDVISLHNVTEHLMQLETVFQGLVPLCHEKTKIIFNHHNYYCWNGHHQSPNQPNQIIGESGDEKQKKLMDWRHIPYADTAAADDYVLTHLNRVTLDEIKRLTEKYFKIEDWREVPSSKATIERLTPEILKDIQKTHPHLTRRDLEINVVLAVNGVKT